MITGNLNTTNLLLGIMAAVSVLQAILLVAVGVMAYRLYTEAMRTVRDVEARHIAPLVAKANMLMIRADAILLDVKDVTSVVTNRTERVDAAIRSTMDRVDDTAWRMRSSVWSRLNHARILFQAARGTVDALFHNGRRASGDSPEHA
jgi:hypothetical protein